MNALEYKSQKRGAEQSLRTTHNNEITLDSILVEFRDLASRKREMGDAFELLMVVFLRSDPTYEDRFDAV